MAPEQLNELLRVRLSETEKQMLTQLADRHGMKLSQCVRRLVREAFESEFGKLPSPPKKKRTK